MAVSRLHALREYTGYPTVDSGDKPSSAPGVGIQGVSKVMARIVARGGDHDGVGGTEVPSGSEEVPPQVCPQAVQAHRPSPGRVQIPTEVETLCRNGAVI